MAGEAEMWKSLPQNHLKRSTKLPWYHTTFEHKLKPEFRALLEEWSKVPDENVVAHVYQVPCIGEFWFIEQGLLRHPDYPRILQRMTSSATPSPRFLDLGTCLGQDVRTLLHAGASPSAVYGADVLPGFKDAGYTLFQDRDRFDDSHFITDDIFSEVDELARTRDQQAASKNILKLLKLVSGSMIVGTQTGSLDAGDFKLQPPLCEPGQDKTIYRQSKETLRTLFEDAAQALGISVRVWTEYDEGIGESGGDWKNEGRVFVGSKERRIFLRIELL
ncbi:hypothetical protein F5Y16DRAFT_423087 [Xylariaceae sp. FL0255]|nr:hypothetical protein F5Y16DRAFT_423087 [Xylariaceae sp. FL0255]